MAKIGLYFGSFNPVHIGHIAIAGYMTEFAGIDQIWFVVSPHNPLKKKETLLADHQRLHMVNLAIGDYEKMSASDIEFRLPVPSYTIDTLIYLREKFPKHRFHLVMGEDNLYTLHKWKNVNELIKEHTFFVYPRNYTDRGDLLTLNDIIAKADIRFIDAPRIEISGTFIRDGIKNGKNMSYFLPPAVWKYISEMHFYENKKDNQ
jgi:nicotinate-nucleotide adenylyltransferase